MSIIRASANVIKRASNNVTHMRPALSRSSVIRSSSFLPSSFTSCTSSSFLRPSSAFSASHAPSRLLSIRTGPTTPHIPVRTNTPPSSSYSIRESGLQNTKEWRLFIQYKGNDISGWHDIPILAHESSHKQLLFNYVNEIPKHTRPKMEISTKELNNPIKQDIKKDKLRLFTYGDLPFNYGCIPQTWEDPAHTHELTKAKGDNDPIDVVELSEQPLRMGQISSIKVVGVLALLDEGETDWKIIAIDSLNPLASQIHSMEDVETHFPGKSASIIEWFRNYKTTDGKGKNEFAFNDRIMDVGLAHKVIWETHAAWAALCKNELPKNELWTPKEAPPAAKGEEL